MARLALALAASLALAAPARAQIRPPPDAPPPSSAPAPGATPGPRAAPGKPAVEPPTSPAALPRGAVLEEVAGTIRGVDLRAHRLSLETPSGPVTLSLDRNTMVYTTAGLGTVLDLANGAQVRAGRNADFLAYWVQVRAAAAKATPGPAQGPGPGSGSGPPPGEAPGTRTSPPPPAASGGATPPGARPAP